MTEQIQHTPIDPATQVGLLSLTVADLERSLYFYTEAMGFSLLERSDGAAVLGAGTTPLLLLAEHPGAEPFPHDQYGHTGLYHFAVLTPTRADLGRWLQHWLDMGFPLPGQGDHVVSEALYLSDPDGNGIEMYADRPREGWRTVRGQIQMGTGPVDIQGLLQEAQNANQAWTGLPSGTRLGHMHLQVGDIPEALNFYHAILGFDVMAAMPSALFLSAGGYHHHLGLNTWHSKSAPPAPAGMAGLRFFSIELPSEEARQTVVDRVEAAGLPVFRAGSLVAVRDPWDNTILLQVGSAAGTQAALDLADVFSKLAAPAL